MARYKPYNPDQSLLLPVTLKDHIYPGFLEETIDIMVEQHLDLTLFDQIYHTNENIDLCEQESIDAYIPDTNFRKRDPNFKDQKRFRDGVNKPPKKKGKFEKFSLNDFTYDNKNDVYICPKEIY